MYNVQHFFVYIIVIEELQATCHKYKINNKQMYTKCKTYINLAIYGSKFKSHCFHFWSV